MVLKGVMIADARYLCGRWASCSVYNWTRGEKVVLRAAQESTWINPGQIQDKMRSTAFSAHTCH